MDGFAVRSADIPGQLPVLGTIAAGRAPDAELAAGHAWRIMTGAPMPSGADAVVIRERVDDRGDSVGIEVSARSGENVRRAGEDVAVGDTVVTAGTRLGPGEIGIIAALGHAALSVHRRPRVAILSTGDELVGVDVVPGPGQIVNANSYALAAQVRRVGAVPVAVGIAPDRREPLVESLRRALQADVLLTSGGVSVGDYDIVRSVLDELGISLEFWKVAMKPGKPLAFGVADTGALFFGLPGNPVSSMVAFELFARPALLAMQGAARIDRPRATAILTTEYRKKPGRAHFARARVRRVSGPDGDRLEATPHPKQGSGMMSSMVGVDALLELSPELGDCAPGTPVTAILLEPL
jgi:molybdopterin molybdotransferase